MSNGLNVREPAVAGMFYPNNKLELDREIAMLLEESKDYNIPGVIKGIIVPHAGYMYSGGVAARAYRQILDHDIEVVVVISPSHTEYFTEVSVFNGYAYATPLGTLPVDHDLAEKITSFNPQIILSDKGHRFEEHALEVQLPFLQKVIEEFRFVPIVMGEHSKDNIRTLSQALQNVLAGQKALIVASSDLSHFYTDEKATELDRVAATDIENMDEDQLYKDLQNGRCEMCGGGPAMVALKAGKGLGADKAKVLLYRNSGEITDDRTEVVGYLSAVIYQEK